VLGSERSEARRARPEHKPIDEEACEEQYEGCIFSAQNTRLAARYSQAAQRYVAPRRLLAF
jgi:hypothetical protein